MGAEVGEVLVSADELQRRVAELGEEISRDYAGRPLLLVGVLKGAVFFLSDLMRYIDIPVEVDFMAVASYGSATDSSGVVRILKDLDAAIADRDVLIVEDIVDSGLTLQYLMRNLGARDPRSLEVCALLTKPDRRKVELPTRYVGFEIPDKFAIGYGLDVGERFRNLPYVAALAEGCGPALEPGHPNADDGRKTVKASTSPLIPSTPCARRESHPRTTYEQVLQERGLPHPDRGGAGLLRAEAHLRPAADQAAVLRRLHPAA